MWRLNMKIIKIDYLTWYFFLVLFLCGYIKIGLIILGIVLWHELGHVLVSKVFHFKILEVRIYPFGGITKLEKDINTPLHQEFFLGCAGIAMQIILGIAIFLMPLDMNLKEIIVKYNTSILLFNMLPIVPLDGAFIVNSFLNYIFSYKLAYRLMIVISVLGVLTYGVSNYFFNLNNYLLLGLFIYKIYEYIKNYKYVINRFLLERYLKKISFRNISTKKGDLDILKIGTYQYFKEGKKIVSEQTKLAQRFDKEGL